MVARRLVPLLTVLAALAASPTAFAATPLSPANGATTDGTPSFVVAVGSGDDGVEVQVATSPKLSAYGLATGRIGICYATGSGPSVGCGLGGELKPGTYYWAALYEHRGACSKQACYPEQKLTAVSRFVVRGAPPPPAPAPAPSPQPTPAPQPAPTGPPSPTGALPRPPDGGPWRYSSSEAPPYASASAVVHYVTTGADAPPLNDDDRDGVPDYVEQIGAAADTALAYYAAHGFRAPLTDSGGPDGKPDIYVKHFTSPDLYGVTIAPVKAAGGSFVVVSSHLDETLGLSRGSLAATVAHELFHVIQFAYLPDGSVPRWVAEGSATAMELLVYPKIDDLVDTAYLDAWLAEPWRPLFDERFYCDHCYGGAWWWTYLMEGDAKLLPQYLDALAARRSSGARIGDGTATLDATVRARDDGSLESVFASFAVALYHAGLKPRATYSLASGHVHVAALNGLSMHYVPIEVPAHARRVTVTVASVSGRAPHASLVVGGPKGRIVGLGTTPLRNRAEQRHVMLVVASAGTAPARYRVAVTAR